MNEFKDLTDEQKVKVKALQKKYIFKSILRGATFALTLFAADFVIAVVNAGFVHNENFVFLAGTVSFVLVFYNLMVQNAKEHDKIKEEVEKILTSPNN
jgi:hypothetical protein